MKINKKISSFLMSVLMLALYIGLIVSIANNNLAWSIIFLSILITKSINDLGEKITTTQKPFLEKSVTKFIIDPYIAIIRNKRFGELFGLKTNTKEFSEWSKSDMEKLSGKGGIKETLKDKLFGISITYLPHEDVYFVKDNSNYANFVSRKFEKTRLYFNEVSGNLNGSLRLEIYERIPHYREKNPIKPLVEELKFLSVCLKYYDKDAVSSNNKNEFIILCELPLEFLIDRDLLGDEKWKELYKQADDYMKKAGFEVRDDHFPDWPRVKDDFGEEPEQYSINSYRKNGVEITFIS